MPLHLRAGLNHRDTAIGPHHALDVLCAAHALLDGLPHFTDAPQQLRPAVPRHVHTASCMAGKVTIVCSQEQQLCQHNVLALQLS